MFSSFHSTLRGSLISKLEKQSFGEILKSSAGELTLDMMFEVLGTLSPALVQGWINLLKKVKDIVFDTVKK